MFRCSNVGVRHFRNISYCPKARYAFFKRYISQISPSSITTERDSVEFQQPDNNMINFDAKILGFINFENDLLRVKQSNSIETKLEFLLKHNQTISIFDLNISTLYLNDLFSRLINDYKINFNATKINGIGKLLNIIKNNTEGIKLIENCGILNADEDIIVRTFTEIYDDKLRRITIDILIETKNYNKAYNLLNIYEQLSDSSQSKITKWKFKLLKFEEFQSKINLNSSDIIENNLLHVYLRSLLNYSKYSTNEIFEFYLLILFKSLSLNLHMSENEIHSLNTTFLSILLKQEGINYNIYLSYFISLYPNSKKLLKSLSLLSNSTLKNLPNVNIRGESVQECLPSNEDLSLLYEKYLEYNQPDDTKIYLLLKKYCLIVSDIQIQQYKKSSIDKNYHPFDKLHHDTSILSSFIKHILSKTYKNNYLIYRIIKRGYENLGFIRQNKSLITKDHNILLSNFINQLIDIDGSNSDIYLALELYKLFSELKITLRASCYLNLIKSLIRLDHDAEAKEIYIWVLENEDVSTCISWDDLYPIVSGRSWPHPPVHVKLLEDAINRKFTYDSNYLENNKISPIDIINELDKGNYDFATKQL